MPFVSQAVEFASPPRGPQPRSKGDDPSTYVFMERYRDDEAMAAHRGMDHFRTLGREMGAFMDGAPSVLRMSELG